MSAPASLPLQSKWLVRHLAAQTGMTELDVEQGILELIERGHLRLCPGAGPDGSDAFEPILKERANG